MSNKVAVFSMLAAGFLRVYLVRVERYFWVESVGSQKLSAQKDKKHVSLHSFLYLRVPFEAEHSA